MMNYIQRLVYSFKKDSNILSNIPVVISCNILNILQISSLFNDFFTCLVLTISFGNFFKI